MAGFGSLGPKTKNLVVAGGLTGFVFGVYFYTMRAVGGSDELQGIPPGKIHAVQFVVEIYYCVDKMAACR
ncbi:hypothetical protein CTI12_AA150080 [Artemisia annua]|uniref:Cytochrome c oxidase assembly factor 3 mitochondrial coiled-coil domain-containing protein n=1 Tax=Artemisia annua TaxID=35608 RepID=A0A2U1PI27_ARTAN|nr:hypothetical protein CTI12_AA150080 [Artemisia annua]